MAQEHLRQLVKHAIAREFSDEIDLSKRIKESQDIDFFFSLHPFSGKLDIYFRITLQITIICEFPRNFRQNWCEKRQI